MKKNQLNTERIVIGTTPNPHLTTKPKPVFYVENICLGCGADEFVNGNHCKKCQEEGPRVSIDDALSTIEG